MNSLFWVAAKSSKVKLGFIILLVGCCRVVRAVSSAKRFIFEF